MQEALIKILAAEADFIEIGEEEYLNKPDDECYLNDSKVCLEADRMVLFFKKRLPR